MTNNRRNRRFLSWLTPFLLAPLPAAAWNAGGHRLVACIAWENLRPSARAESAQLLQAHPDYVRWVKRGEGTSQQEPRSYFIEASTWPDEIRQDERFYTPGKEEPTPLLAGFPDMERHTQWHYLQRPIDGSPPPVPPRGSIDKQLVALVAELTSAKMTTEKKAYALPWLIHLVGDVHQPLHVALRRDEHGNRDKLGTGFKIINPFNPRKNRTTLHVY